MMPSIGSIVHYCEGPYIFAALVVAVANQTARTFDELRVVNLIFWTSSGLQYTKLKVPYSELLELEDGHWRWPPKI